MPTAEEVPSQLEGEDLMLAVDAVDVESAAKRGRYYTSPGYFSRLDRSEHSVEVRAQKRGHDGAALEQLKASLQAERARILPPQWDPYKNHPERDNPWGARSMISLHQTPEERAADARYREEYEGRVARYLGEWLDLSPDQKLERVWREFRIAGGEETYQNLTPEEIREVGGILVAKKNERPTSELFGFDVNRLLKQYRERQQDARIAEH